MFISVVIPTYNRLPILRKCLSALEKQELSNEIDGYEVIVVDDGSTDGTIDFLYEKSQEFIHVRLIKQNHAGPGQARNNGVQNAKGNVIVFIDSDLVVTKTFLSSHIRSLKNAWKNFNNKLCFTYGPVINTANFTDPTTERHKLRDTSWAYFATGNVAIDRGVLEQAGLFDPAFKLYGWEDLELGERLKMMGVKLVKSYEAKGYHWHPALTIKQIPDLIRIERERAKMALIFYLKHPTFRVRLITQYTYIHRFLWEFLTLGGIINTNTLKPLLNLLINNGHPSIAMEILRIPLNLIGVREIFREAKRLAIR